MAWMDFCCITLTISILEWEAGPPVSTHIRTHRHSHTEELARVGSNFACYRKWSKGVK